MAVAVASMARNSRPSRVSTPRAAHNRPDPNTAHSLEGDTLLGSPDTQRPAQSSPPARITKRHPATSGRVEKSRPAQKKSSIASRLLSLFTSFPSPKRAFFSSSAGLNRGVGSQGSGTATAADSKTAQSRSTSPQEDVAVASIESVDGVAATDQQDQDEAMSESWIPGEQEEPEFTDWREEQLALNIVLRARHEFTLLPSTWKYNLRGIPIPDTLFYTQTKSKSMRPRIYAMQNRFEYQGETAFRKLIDVHAQIRDLRKLQVEINSDRLLSAGAREARLAEVSAAITSKISRAIERACVWAESDGNLKRLRDQTPPNIMISVLPSTEEHGDVFIQESMDSLARRWRQKLGIPELEREESVASSFDWDAADGDTTIKVEEDEAGGDGASTKELGGSPQLGTETPKASHRKGLPREEVQASPEELEQQEKEREEEEEQKTPTQAQPQCPPPTSFSSSQTKAPVLFGFVIFKHTLMIVTLDAQDPAAPCNIPISLNMAESNQHQWNALAIMVTICWARDLLSRVVDEIAVDLEAAKARMPSEDPDA
ncbi:uncharacterized protein B0I36DRAFT_349210 [Microdochium trichocladiopsis]|uniref:Uncharacterized protein n=1 Tax=Microdochium trichocladiopsis TaxID=1682393 RepID=A0A9P9BNB3_9PEZI|nr:uncharacterized protein B0I36DRAFT_349210 [Microdochium trichocladiopsis]KAH7031081.1 hypothetical protein B0I36DRAFT_349210 [Microdochium trichocladiopsis]